PARAPLRGRGARGGRGVRRRGSGRGPPARRCLRAASRDRVAGRCVVGRHDHGTRARARAAPRHRFVHARTHDRRVPAPRGSTRPGAGRGHDPSPGSDPMRRLLGTLLATLALVGTVRAQDFVICKKCMDDAVSDTSASPGFEAQGRRAAFASAHLMLVFVGVDHRARFAQWTAAGWAIESVDGVNRAAGLAMGFDDTGLPIVSYHDSTGGVVFARRIGAGWNVQTIFPELEVTGPTSLAHIPGITGIACVNSASHELLYLQQIGNAPWTIESVSPVLPGAGDPSLVMEPGARAVAFRDGAQGVLRLTTSGDSPPWQVQLVDGTPGTGGWASLIGHAGDYGIAYHDGPDHQLRYAHSNPGGWTIDIVDGLGARHAGPACAAVE